MLLQRKLRDTEEKQKIARETREKREMKDFFEAQFVLLGQHGSGSNQKHFTVEDTVHADKGQKDGP